MYPLTNSLSPSEKSKGERFNSVKITINKIKIINKIKKLNLNIILKFLFIIKKIKIIKNKIISKEILWLEKVIEPKKEYLDLLNKPINKNKKTEKLIILINNIILIILLKK